MGVRGSLLLAFLSVSMFSLVAAVTGILSLTQVSSALDDITEERVPEALAWLELSRSIERVVQVAPALLAATTEAQRETVSSDMFQQMQDLSALLDRARSYGGNSEGRAFMLDGAIDVSAAANRATELVERINENFVSIDEFVVERLAIIEDKSAALRQIARGNSNARRILAPGSRIVQFQVTDWINSSAVQDGSELSMEQADLARSIIRFLPEQQAAVLFDEFNSTMLVIADAETSEQVDVLSFPIESLLQGMSTQILAMPTRVANRLSRQLERLSGLSTGPDGLPEIRKRELMAITQAEELLGLNRRLSSFLANRTQTLVTAANQRIEIANEAAIETGILNRNILFAVVAMSIVSSLMIVWFYVSRSLTARLTALSESMMAISSGDLHATLPSNKGNDEISRMANALVVFRDTAIEVEESNLREVATARQRLIDAIESINEGFAFYDADDRLVLSNERYKDLLYDQVKVDITPGTSFETILRNAVDTGLIDEALDDPEAWIKGRIERHQNPGQPLLQQRAGNRWIMVSERKVAGGGTVALYSDLTTIKEYERELQNSQARFSQLFENAPVALFEEDWSGIKSEIERLKSEGVTDLERYFEEHPEFVANFANLVVWKDFNPAAISLYGAADVTSLRAHLSETEVGYDWDIYAQAALAFDRGENHAPREVIEQTVDGQDITIVFTCQIGSDLSDWSSIATTSQDITTLKKREEQLSHANQQIMSSVHYASRIQEAMLPSRRALGAVLPDHFLIWEPRDIVGGDFFWCHETDRGAYIIVGDCTGHGVPGAFMTLIGCGLIDRHLRTNDRMKPSELLSAMHKDLQELLGQNEKNSETDDGLEAGVCFIDSASGQMTFAGSRSSLFVVTDDSIDEIKGDKAGIGYHRYSADTQFTDTKVAAHANDRFILATDGLFDQVGGEKRRGFGKARLREFIDAHRTTHIAEQGDALRATLAGYQGDEYRRDDLTVLGFKVPSS